MDASPTENQFVGCTYRTCLQGKNSAQTVLAVSAAQCSIVCFCFVNIWVLGRSEIQNFTQGKRDEAPKWALDCEQLHGHHRFTLGKLFDSCWLWIHPNHVDYSVNALPWSLLEIWTTSSIIRICSDLPFQGIFSSAARKCRFPFFLRRFGNWLRYSFHFLLCTNCTDCIEWLFLLMLRLVWRSILWTSFGLLLATPFLCLFPQSDVV